MKIPTLKQLYFVGVSVITSVLFLIGGILILISVALFTQSHWKLSVGFFIIASMQIIAGLIIINGMKKKNLKNEAVAQIVHEKLCPMDRTPLINYRMEDNGSGLGLTADCPTCKKYMRVQSYWSNKEPLTLIKIKKSDSVD